MISNIIKKSNTSSDTQLVRNLNTAVAMGIAENGNKKAETAYEAMQYADENGYDVAKIVAKSDNKIAWSVETGEFVLIDTTNHTAIYPTTNGSTELNVADNKVTGFFALMLETGLIILFNIQQLLLKILRVMSISRQPDM